MSVTPKYSQRELSCPWGLPWCPTITHPTPPTFCTSGPPALQPRAQPPAPPTLGRGACSLQAQTLGAWGHWRCSAGHPSPPPPPLLRYPSFLFTIRISSLPQRGWPFQLPLSFPRPPTTHSWKYRWVWGQLSWRPRPPVCQGSPGSCPVPSTWAPLLGPPKRQRDTLPCLQAAPQPLLHATPGLPYTAPSAVTF